MAGNWIKVRWNLSRDARVLAMAEHVGLPDSDLSARAVSFMLVEVWGLVMEQGERDKEDALLMHANLATLDRVIDTPKFGEAMAQVGWVSSTTFDGKRCLRFPNLLRDNKLVKEQRRDNAERQRKHREKSRSVDADDGISDRNALRGVTSNGADKSREDKREENTQSVNPNAQAQLPICDADASPVRAVARTRDGSRQFSQRTLKVWEACGWRKVGRRGALLAIERAGAILATERFGKDRDAACAFLAERARAYTESPLAASTPKQFLPHPATWFNEGRYDDDPSEWATAREDNGGDGPTLEIA